MYEAWKKLRTGGLSINICTLVLGILMLIWPDISMVVACVILGLVCIVNGIYELVRYFKLGLAGMFFRFDLSLGLFSILIGILLLLHPYGAITFLPIATGFYMMIGSITDIQLSIEMYRSQLRHWWISLVLGIINIFLAIAVTLNPFDAAEVLMCLIALVLIVKSVQNVYFLYCVSKKIETRKNGNLLTQNGNL